MIAADCGGEHHNMQHSPAKWLHHSPALPLRDLHQQCGMLSCVHIYSTLLCKDVLCCCCRCCAYALTTCDIWAIITFYLQLACCNSVWHAGVVRFMRQHMMCISVQILMLYTESASIFVELSDGLRMWHAYSGPSTGPLCHRWCKGCCFA